MRKDKLSSFQAKKQKLLKIKEIIDEHYKKCEILKSQTASAELKIETSKNFKLPPKVLKEIWEIVKDEN